MGSDSVFRILRIFTRLRETLDKGTQDPNFLGREIHCRGGEGSRDEDYIGEDR